MIFYICVFTYWYNKNVEQCENWIHNHKCHIEKNAQCFQKSNSLFYTFMSRTSEYFGPVRSTSTWLGSNVYICIFFNRIGIIWTSRTQWFTIEWYIHCNIHCIYNHTQLIYSAHDRHVIRTGHIIVTIQLLYFICRLLSINSTYACPCIQWQSFVGVDHTCFYPRFLFI